MSSKRISPRTANQRIDRISSDNIKLSKCEKGDMPYRYKYRPFITATSDSQYVVILANKIKNYFLDIGFWPNWYSRGWKKDRLFKRAMRLAKKEVKG